MPPAASTQVTGRLSLWLVSDTEGPFLGTLNYRFRALSSHSRLPAHRAGDSASSNGALLGAQLILLPTTEFQSSRSLERFVTSPCCLWTFFSSALSPETRGGTRRAKTGQTHGNLSCPIQNGTVWVRK